MKLCTTREKITLSVFLTISVDNPKKGYLVVKHIFLLLKANVERSLRMEEEARYT